MKCERINDNLSNHSPLGENKFETGDSLAPLSLFVHFLTAQNRTQMTKNAVVRVKTFDDRLGESA